MVKKRLIGVITVLDGLAVQSIGYKKYLPIGKPAILAKNLENWGVDEIFIQAINRSKNNKGPDIDLLSSISNLTLSTPVTYGGGIACLEDAIQVIKIGCDRISIDSLVHENITEVKKISYKLGSQAIIVSVPVNITNEKLYWFDYKNEIDKKNFEILEGLASNNLISEICLIDKANEGQKGSFNEQIINLFPIQNIPFILFGGITETEQIKNFFKKEIVSSVAIGNSLNYKEHSIQILKSSLKDFNLRNSFYSQNIF